MKHNISLIEVLENRNLCSTTNIIVPIPITTVPIPIPITINQQTSITSTEVRLDTQTPKPISQPLPPTSTTTIRTTPVSVVRTPIIRTPTITTGANINTTQLIINLKQQQQSNVFFIIVRPKNGSATFSNNGAHAAVLFFYGGSKTCVIDFGDYAKETDDITIKGPFLPDGSKINWRMHTLDDFRQLYNSGYQMEIYNVREPSNYPTGVPKNAFDIVNSTLNDLSNGLIFTNYDKSKSNCVQMAATLLAMSTGRDFSDIITSNMPLPQQLIGCNGISSKTSAVVDCTGK